MPQGWSVCHLADIANSELGKTLDKEKNTGIYRPYLCAKNVQWNSFDLTSVKEMRFEEEEKQRYSLKKGDLLICEGGEVGRCAIWESNASMYYQNALHRVRFIEGIEPHYFLCLLKHYHNTGLIAAYSKGMTIKHFTKSALNVIPLIFPPVNEQHRIVNKIKELYFLLDSISQILFD